MWPADVIMVLTFEVLQFINSTVRKILLDPLNYFFNKPPPVRDTQGKIADAVYSKSVADRDLIFWIPEINGNVSAKNKKKRPSIP